MTGSVVVAQVIADERMCREWLRQLEFRGVTIPKDPDALTHEECVEIAMRAYIAILDKAELQ